MISLYKRVIVAVLSTTILHASLFYSLNEVKQPRIVKNKTIEIELVQEAKEEKKELVKEKKLEKPKPVVKPITKPVIKPKPIVKEKPKPIVKPKPIAKLEPKPKPIVKTQPKPIEIKEEIEEKEVEEVTQKEEPKEITKPSTSQESTLSQDAKNSTISADELEIYLYKVRVKIQQNLRYPPLARRLKIQGESVVAFNILSNGSVEGSTISTHTSSGNSSLDRQAINTILQVSPFEAPPKGKISIIVPVAFNLK